jgi:competence protein ComEC
LRLDAALVLGAACIALGLALPAARLRTALALLLALAAGAVALAVRLDAAGRWEGHEAREIAVEATVREALRGPWGWRLKLGDVVGVAPGPPPPPRVRVLGQPTPPGVAAFEAAVPGERVRVRLRLRPPRGLRNPGAPDRERRARREGIGAVGRLVDPALHARIPERNARGLLGLWQGARARLGRRLARAGPGGALLRALALGDRSDLPEAAREAFARLGIAHLLAVSGLHLGLLASLVYGGVRLGPGRLAWLAARRDTRVVALVAGVVAAAAYAVLAGWGVPVRRALIFLLALLLGLTRQRPGLRLQPLALAALLILAWEPEALFAPGAQLSFAACAALALAAPRDPLAPARLDMLRVSASALAATAPLAALLLGSQAPFALLVNLLAIPWTGWVLLPASLAATAAAAAGEGPATGLLLAASERLAAGTLAAAGLLAEHLPGGVGRAAPAWPWLAAAGLLAAGALVAQRTATRVGLSAAIGGLLWLAPPARLAPEPPRAVFLDVGQGDATLVQGRRATLLVDAGVAVPGGPDLGRSAVVPALLALGVTHLDLLLATHTDLDHRGGIPAVLEAFPVSALWVPRGARAEPGFAALREAARVHAVPIREHGAGDPTHRLGDLAITPLWPPAATAAISSNDRSLVVRIEVAGHRLLLPGDVEAAAEAGLLANAAHLRADVLKLPHHGSRSSSTQQFLLEIDAAVAVASAPCAGRFAMPDARMLARARAAQLSVWWTGRDGAVLVGLGERLRVWGTGAPRSCLREHAARARPSPILHVDRD